MEIYVSTDVEADGPIPGPNSMLSFGSAAYLADKSLVGTFEANLETLSGAQGDARTMEWWKGQPEAWQAEYTSELLNVLHVLTLLIDLEPRQAALLDRICAGPALTNAELAASGAFELPARVSRTVVRRALGKRGRYRNQG